MKRKGVDMEKLIFDGDNTHHDHMNITVRNGTKWRKLDIGDKIMCCKLGEDTGPIGTVNLICCCTLRNCPDSLLQKEHDKSCRYLGGLIKVLDRVYKKKFIGSEIVTLIGYTLEGE